MEPAIVIHGGAGGTGRGSESMVAALKESVIAGMKLMRAGGTSVDAVEAAVCILEDCPLFNAGTGSVLRRDGGIEMDALIMEGADLKAGTVAGVKGVKNPVKLARLVMEKTEHVQLCGDGAAQFARSMGVRQIPDEELRTPDRVKSLEKYLAKENTERGCDTVGAVAIDSSGCISCATSTGGMTGSLSGRVGDCPQIGCGGYADNSIGGVSTTGAGENIARVVLARLILFHMKQGHSIQASIDKALQHMKERTGSSSGGAIVISNEGEIGKGFTTQGMLWASLMRDQLHWGITHGDDFVKVVAKL